MNAPITADEARRLALKFCGPAKEAPINTQQGPAKKLDEGKANKTLILKTLRRLYRASAKEVALAAGLHITTTRNHLGALRVEGMVSTNIVRKGQFNHPVEVWSLTEMGKGWLS